MRIVVVSDVHGCFERLYRIIKKENPQMVMFSGDGNEDIDHMQFVFPDIKFLTVRGNCDYDSDFKDEELVEILGRKIFITHGHIYGVKRNYHNIEIKGREEGADVAIFGHTHSPYLSKKENIILFNPGAVLCGSYGVINIEENKKIELIHKEIQ